MPEFDLDNFKKTWQEQDILPKYDSTEIEAMLNKSSRNYVKYILWICIAEFSVFFCLNLYYAFIGDDNNSFIRIMEKLGVKNTTSLENGFSNLFLSMKIISLVLTAFFVLKFFQNYRRINIESNLKKLILQIISFKKTVNLFILTNIFLIILFTIVLTAFTFKILSQQNIHLNNPTLIGFLVGTVIMMAISVILIWIYYRLVYGILLKRLSKNLEDLQKIDQQQQ